MCPVRQGRKLPGTTRKHKGTEALRHAISIVRICTYDTHTGRDRPYIHRHNDKLTQCTHKQKPDRNRSAHHRHTPIHMETNETNSTEIYRPTLYSTESNGPKTSFTREPPTQPTDSLLYQTQTKETRCNGLGRRQAATYPIPNSSVTFLNVTRFLPNSMFAQPNTHQTQPYPTVKPSQSSFLK